MCYLNSEGTNSLNFFSGRNHKDKFFGFGKEIEKEIYFINGFEVQIFTEKIQDFTEEDEFLILCINEDYE